MLGFHTRSLRVSSHNAKHIIARRLDRPTPATRRASASADELKDDQMFQNASLALRGLLGKVRASLIGPYVDALIIDANGCKLVVPKDDLAVGKTLAFSGTYDSEQLALYARFINADSRVLVVGAHVGSILFPLAKLCKEMFAIEANPRTFRFLQMGIALNGFSNINIIQVAASDREETLSFMASRTNSGGAKIRPLHDRTEFTYDNPEIIDVKGVRLDDVITDKAFDLIIVDIEGAEFKALGGMGAILSLSNTVVCELLPNHLKYVAGVDFDDLLGQFPERFSHFSLTYDPSTIYPRSAAREMYERVERERGKVGGADMICYSNLPAQP